MCKIFFQEMQVPRLHCGYLCNLKGVQRLLWHWLDKWDTWGFLPTNWITKILRTYFVSISRISMGWFGLLFWLWLRPCLEMPLILLAKRPPSAACLVFGQRDIFGQRDKVVTKMTLLVKLFYLWVMWAHITSKPSSDYVWNVCQVSSKLVVRFLRKVETPDKLLWFYI